MGKSKKVKPRRKSFKLLARASFDLNKKINAEEVSSELDKLPVLTPEAIVRRARDRSNPLHKYFEWSDTKAAHLFRLNQARHLVLSIGFTDGEQFTKKYESVVIDKQRVYLPLTEIKKDTSLMEQVLQAALDEILYWKQKHQRYQKYFGKVFGEITKAEKQIRKKYGKDEEGND
jgi:hypothetical protein